MRHRAATPGSTQKWRISAADKKDRKPRNLANNPTKEKQSPKRTEAKTGKRKIMAAEKLIATRKIEARACALARGELG
jgi:hypothetical protein